MSEFETRDWRRYGKDRTYVVDTATGAQVGYRDNATGDLVPADPTTVPALQRWAQHAKVSVPPERPTASDTAAAPVAVVEPSPPAPAGSVAGAPALAPVPATLTAPALPATLTVPPVPAAPAVPAVPTQRATAADAAAPDEDLALRRPGQAARARAERELAARRASVGKFWTWLGRVFDVRTDERAWRIGAAAEETIGAELERLVKHGWRVLHSVPVGAGDSDIDHVLIGPTGVFTVNSKHRPNARVWVVPRQIRVNNQPVPYLRNSRHEAARAGRLLSAAIGTPVTATPVLIFRLGKGSLTIRERPDDVLVLRATKARRPLRRRPTVLEPAQVEAIYEAARWRSTWQPR